MAGILSISKSYSWQYAKAILRDIGLLFHIPGLMAVLSLPICLLAGEAYAIGPFAITACLSLGLGQGLYQTCKHAEESQLRHAVVIVALGWGLIPFLGAIPLLGVALSDAATPSLTLSQFRDPMNALFEGFSGFTSAGLTMALDSSELPRCLQWWRSLMQWVGGVGVIVLMLSVLEPSTDPYQLYNFEGRQKLIGLTLRETVRRIWWIYGLFTVGGLFLFRITGMAWWPALNHAMTAIATGGFAITGQSMTPYSPATQLAVTGVMIFGAISFKTHSQLLRRKRLSILWRDSQHKLLWFLLGVGFVAVLFEQVWFTDRLSALQVWFQWVSALTTCGFASVDIQSWSTTNKLLLSLAMVFGGAAGSTVGGLKLSRIASLWQGVMWRFQRLSLLPHQMMRYKLDGEVITEAEANRRVESATVLAVLWLSSLFIAVLLLIHVQPYQYTLADTLFEAASALGSAGLSVGITHPELPQLGKIVLIVLMWMGRLEIIPVLALLIWPLMNLKRTLGRLL
ncbi:MAG: TrkH family potassium uptake protein [Cyanobacteria bacterium J06636_16]